MSPAQQARVEGFRAALAVRGVALDLPSANATIRGIVEHGVPDHSEYGLARETAVGNRLHFLRSHLTGIQVKVGSVFRDPVARVTHRVTEVEDDPANVAVVFTAETAAELAE